MQKEEVLEIWNKSKPKVINFIRKNVKTETDIDDIVQEVFIKFWDLNKKIKDKNKILSWLYSVARNTIADYYRKKENSLVFEIDKLSLADENICHSDESKKLIPIINSLPVKYKTVLLMSDIYGLSHKEIAFQFNLTLSCVKTRVVRARKLLSERMKECCSFKYDKYGNIIECSEKQAYFDCLKKYKKKYL